MICTNVKGLEANQVKKILRKLEESLRNKYQCEMIEFGREIREVSRERSREIRVDRTRKLKQTSSKSRQIKVSIGIETSVEEGVEKNSHRQIQVSKRCQGTNHQIPEQKLNRSTRCREAIEDVETFLINTLGVEKLSRLR